MCKGRATLNSTWSGEPRTPLWCSWLEKKVKPLWRPLWLRWPLWRRTSPTQTYLLAKEGNCGKQILRLVSSPCGDIFPLPCSYFVTCALFVICRPEYPPYQAGDSGPRVSAVHSFYVTSVYLLHIHLGPHLYLKVITFCIC